MSRTLPLSAVEGIIRNMLLTGMEVSKELTVSVGNWQPPAVFWSLLPGPQAVPAGLSARPGPSAHSVSLMTSADSHPLSPG